MTDAQPAPEPLSIYPLLFIAAAFALGAATSAAAFVPLKFSLPAAVAGAGVGIYFLRRGENARATITVLASFVLLGIVFAAVENRLHSGPTVQHLYDAGLIPSGDPVEVTGVIARAPEPSTDGFYLLVQVESVRYAKVDYAVAGTVWLFAPVGDAATLDQYTRLEPRYGARIRVVTALKRADQFRNPGVTVYTEFLDHRGYDAIGTIKTPALVERLEDERVFLPLAWLFEIRQRLLAAIVKRFDPDTAGVLAASMLGNRYYLSADTSEKFRTGGTFHILIISGLHISALGLFALWLVRKFTRNRWLQYLIPVGLIWGYTAAVGAESTIVRAAVMFTGAGASFVIFRRSSGLNALGASALLLLAWRPSELFSPSFQLTFVAVLAIVGVAVPVLLKMKGIGEWRPTAATPVPPRAPGWLLGFSEFLWWSERGWRAEQARSAWKCRLFKSKFAVRTERWRLQRPARYLFSGLFVSLCVQFAMLPLAVIYFHRLSPVSLILNFLVGPLLALLSFGGFLALLLSALSVRLGQPLVFAANKLNWLMTHISDPLLRSRWASWRLPEYSGGKASVYAVYLLLFVAIGYFAINWDPFAFRPEGSAWMIRFPRLPIAATTATLLLAAVIVLHPFSADRADGRLHLDFLDVGQGDSILVTFPDGRHLLIDGGGQAKYGDPQNAPGADATSFRRDERNIGEAVVSEYLWHRGIGTVEMVLATHSDTDHMDGLNAVVRNFSVQTAFVGTTPATDQDFVTLSNTLRERGVPLHQVRRNDVLRFGPTTVEFLWPDANLPSETSANNQSVVIKLTQGSRCFLLTGDIERPVEQRLSVDPASLACDVLKVAHHGSRTSSSEEFLTATHPTTAVISVGLTSIFGHPHPEVVERLMTHGVRMMTTGRSGTISVSTDGNDLRIDEFVH
jgi:competence protein ComEC